MRYARPVLLIVEADSPGESDAITMQKIRELNSKGLIAVADGISVPVSQATESVTEEAG